MRTQTYDALGRPLQIDDPNIGFHQYRYNAYGELKQEVVPGATYEDPDQVTTYARDSLGRVTSISSPDAQTTIFWDENHGVGKVDRIRRSKAGKDVFVDYAYDELSRLSISETRFESGGNVESYQTTATYDDLGRIDSLVYPPGPGGAEFKVRYGYDDTKNGQLVTVGRVGAGGTVQNYWTAQGRNEYGQLTQEQFGNGIQRTRKYGERGELRFEAGVRVADGLTVEREAFEYTPGGNLSARHHLAQPVPSSETFEYDPLDRLQKWTVYQRCTPDATILGYDDAGDLIARYMATGQGTEASYTYGNGQFSQEQLDNSTIDGVWSS